MRRVHERVVTAVSAEARPEARAHGSRVDVAILNAAHGASQVAQACGTVPSGQIRQIGGTLRARANARAHGGLDPARRLGRPFS